MKLIFDKDSNGTQELVDALGLIDARTDFSKWKPYIPLSIRRLTAIIGQEVYDKVLDFYQSASVDPDGKLTRLLGMVQQSVALFTWLKIIPHTGCAAWEHRQAEAPGGARKRADSLTGVQG